MQVNSQKLHIKNRNLSHMLIQHSVQRKLVVSAERPTLSFREKVYGIPYGQCL